jgi:hypothetical protein
MRAVHHHLGNIQLSGTATGSGQGRYCPARSVGLGARGVVLLQSAQHAVAVVGQGPVLVLVDDQVEGVDAVVCLQGDAGWETLRLGQ